MQDADVGIEQRRLRHRAKIGIADAGGGGRQERATGRDERRRGGELGGGGVAGAGMRLIGGMRAGGADE